MMPRVSNYPRYVTGENRGRCLRSVAQLYNRGEGCKRLVGTIYFALEAWEVGVYGL